MNTKKKDQKKPQNAYLQGNKKSNYDRNHQYLTFTKQLLPTNLQKPPSTQEESQSETQRKHKIKRRSKFKEKQDKGKIVIKTLRKPKLALIFF